MKRALVALIAALCLLALIGCKKEEARRVRIEVALADMVTFDRAYIPALMATNTGERAKARKAMDGLLAVWQPLYAKYMHTPGSNPQWRADFDNIDRMIHLADSWLQEGQPPQEAHGVLEGVRTLLTDLRLGYGITYDLDFLNQFHEPMEAIAQAAQQKTPGSLTENDLARIDEYLRHADSLWKQVEKAAFEPTLYHLTPEQTQRLRAEIAQETAALRELKAALDSDDKARILKAAAALKPHFVAIYTLFGDFAAVE